MAEFCEHLEDYGVQFVRAETAYRALLAQMERVAAGGDDDDALDLLERMMRDWQDEVRDLRKRMVDMVRRGRADAPGDGDEGVSCSLCGAVLPRLVFADFALQEDGTPVFRGQPLTVPAAV